MKYWSVLFIIGVCLACQSPEAEQRQEAKVKKKTHPSENYHYTDVDVSDLAYQETLYVPVYSDIYHLDGTRRFALAATLSLRNVNMQDSVYVTGIDYYDSEGGLVRHYIEKPIVLTALQSVEIVVAHDDAAGGPGANFIVHWGADKGSDKLLAQAVMIGTASQQGLSFTTEGGGYRIYYRAKGAINFMADSGHKEDGLPPQHHYVFHSEQDNTLPQHQIDQVLTHHQYQGEDLRVFTELMSVNQGVFTIKSSQGSFQVVLSQTAEQLIVVCNCEGDDMLLCDHQAEALDLLMHSDDLLIFFDKQRRHQELKKMAFDYGLENEPDLDEYFDIEQEHGRLITKPAHPGLISVTADSLKSLKSQVRTDGEQLLAGSLDHNKNILVLRKHRYYNHLLISIYHAERTQKGKIKNPLVQVNPQNHVWDLQDGREIKFLLGVNKFMDFKGESLTAEDLAVLSYIIKNPLGYEFYQHNSRASDKISASSISQVQVRPFAGKVKLWVSKVGRHFEIEAQIFLGDKSFGLNEVKLKYNCFLEIEEQLHLLSGLQLIRVLDLLNQKGGKLIVHASAFKEFRTQFLDDIEKQIEIEYRFIKEATAEQLEMEGFNDSEEKIIYLSDFDNFVMLIPVMRYSDVEVEVRSRKQIYAYDSQGKEFLVKRDVNKESEFLALMIKQHPFFEEQLEENDLPYFYLHKKRFLEEEWFLKTCMEWAESDITILGFDEIEGNRLNPNPVSIDIKVVSGINWFNAEVDMRYAKQKASMKKVKAAVRNKSKYVQLDDGTFGVLPKEWMKKFEAYFNAGEIDEQDMITFPKVNFSAIESLFETKMLDETVRHELAMYHEKLENFKAIEQVNIPKELRAELRPYQKEGLNWLNFLDDFNFGGCLADDMGLGKSVQIIAFILALKEKQGKKPHLLVVPTTLRFNWRSEIEKFAPELEVLELKGADRQRDTSLFGKYDIILTSYGTLLADVVFLKNFMFDYIFLDESQQIKNPNSQRYKAVRLLKSRNKIVITGTPFENNTFDLYSQFSFACPGLMGSKQFFKERYSAPIDQFKSKKRAKELQDKISPFLLRRTKDQVAQELPEKEELVIYCEMKPEQKRIYEASEKDFRDYMEEKETDDIRKTSMYVLKGLTQLRQICNSPKLLDSTPAQLTETAAKIEVLMEQVDNHAPYHKMLVFSQFVGMLELIQAELEAKGIGYAILTGATKNREEVVTRFQKNEDVRVFLISLKAGGVGLNLTEASYVYMVDPWWNPAVENQAIDRSYRIGQNKRVTAIRLICPGTVEEKIMKLQSSKKELLGGLINDENAILKNLTKEDIMNLVK
ncbi:SNF2-related protein [Fulvivirga maritima]|uniref:SNF2-related protein n=1 Tax=Fulvivirga maritima TaxID=2904247 RepID=UPI001F1F6E82|nr:SNF2-related protein [Fulvivirga maritima]UII26595.1 SNF2-related protein [Fulvivirga maritima]